GYSGRLIQVDGAIGPRPVRPGGPPIWVGGKIARSATRAAQLGDGYLAGTHFPTELVMRQIERYRLALSELGRDPASGAVSLNRLMVLAEDPEQAWSEAAPWLGKLLRKYVALKMLPGAAALADADPGDLAALKSAAAGICLVGSPETVLPELEAYRTAGVNQLQIRPAPSGLPADLVARTITLAGRHLIPHFGPEAKTSGI
ncbi:MAG: LLM class flavin-dependent oxidoreductase, partial [Candidatus Limnocylindrales bacterium]